MNWICLLFCSVFAMNNIFLLFRKKLSTLSSFKRLFVYNPMKTKQKILVFFMQKNIFEYLSFEYLQRK